MYDLVVRGGTVVDGGVFEGDVAVEGERIAAVGRGLEGRRTVDAGGCYVIPGGVDPHVHLQMALGGRVSSDSFADGTVAALCGGTTTVIDFADPQPGESMVDALAARRAEADGNVAADYGLHMTVPAWHAASKARLAETSEVVRQGCATFKLYQAYERVALDDVALLRAMTAVASAGGRAVLHSETGPVLEALREQALGEGHVEPIWHAATRPARLEATAVHRAAELAAIANCPLYIFHVGCAEVVEEIGWARGRGAAIWGESCPQYLFLNAAEHLGGPEGALFVCAPPLRTRADQAAVWSALASGGLDVVSTDHCPWTRPEKDQPRFTEIPGGVPSIEARVALVYQGVRAGRLGLERWVEVCCSAPARLMGLAHKGRVLPGYDADIVVFDPTLDMTIRPSSLHETAGWTPYDGMQLRGWPVTVLLRGQVAVGRGEFGGEVFGRFAPRSFAS